MTLMLASVSSPAEAEIAIAHGADIIDLREPSGAFAPRGADPVNTAPNSCHFPAGRGVVGVAPVSCWLERG